MEVRKTHLYVELVCGSVDTNDKGPSGRRAAASTGNGIHRTKKLESGRKSSERRTQVGKGLRLTSGRKKSASILRFRYTDALRGPISVDVRLSHSSAPNA
jgi:hypothetical protein